mgnify:CR=1 FL=1
MLNSAQLFIRTPLIASMLAFLSLQMPINSAFGQLPSGVGILNNNLTLSPQNTSFRPFDAIRASEQYLIVRSTLTKYDVYDASGTLLRELVSSQPDAVVFGNSYDIDTNIFVTNVGSSSPTTSDFVEVFRTDTGASILRIDRPTDTASIDFRLGLRDVSTNGTHVAVTWQAFVFDNESEFVEGGIIDVYEISTGKLVHRLEPPSPPKNGFIYSDFGRAISINGNTVAVNSVLQDVSLDPLNPTQRREVLHISLPGEEVISRTLLSISAQSGTTIGFSPEIVLEDGRSFASDFDGGTQNGASDPNVIRAIDVSTGAILYTLFDPESATSNSSRYPSFFDASNEFLIVSDRDSRAVSPAIGPAAFGASYLYNASTGALIARLDPGIIPSGGFAYGNGVAIGGDTIWVHGREDAPTPFLGFTDFDCDSNGSVDVSEIALDNSLDCNSNGILDSCEIDSGGGSGGTGGPLDLDNSGQIDFCQINDAGGVNGVGGILDCDFDGILDIVAINQSGGMKGVGGLMDLDFDGQIDFCQINNAGGIDGLGGTLDCNLNGILDTVDLENGGGEGGPLDRDMNGRLDSCDIAENPSLDCDMNGEIDFVEIMDDGSLDCNQDGILDDCQESESSISEVVFILDTSASLSDEGSALCGSIATIENALLNQGLTPLVTVLSTTGSPGGAFPCITGAASVFDLDFAEEPTVDGLEDWGDAVALVAQGFPWMSSNRIIVVIGDEAPATGDPIDAEDELALGRASAAAGSNNVRVIGVAGNGTSDSSASFFERIGEDTRGGFFRTSNPSSDLATGISAALTSIAFGIDCNGNGIIDSCDIDSGFAIDNNFNGIPDECEINANGGNNGQGGVLDCNVNGVLDSFELPVISGDTGEQGPVFNGSSVSLTIPNAPEATTDISIRVSLLGDFAASTQFARLRLNGQFVDNAILPSGEPFLAGTGFGCLPAPIVFDFTLPQALFNSSLVGDAIFELVAGSPFVSEAGCPDGLSRIEVSYRTRNCGTDDFGYTLDCDGNGILDVCDIFGGGATDDDFNLVPDVCDTTMACDGGGPMPGSPVDFNGNGVIDDGDVTEYVTLFLAGDPAAEFDGVPGIDFFDFTEFLNAFEAAGG